MLNIKAPISALSIKYTFQCALTASASDADAASAVTGYGREVVMVTNIDLTGSVPESTDSRKGTTAH